MNAPLRVEASGYTAADGAAAARLCWLARYRGCRKYRDRTNYPGAIPWPGLNRMWTGKPYALMQSLKAGFI